MILLLLLFFDFSLNTNLATSIQFHKKDAVVWHPDQIISGEIDGLEVDIVTVYHDNFPLPVPLDHQKKFLLKLF